MRPISRHIAQLFEPAVKKGASSRLMGRTKGGMNTKLHAVTDRNGRPFDFFMTAGQISDYTGAAALMDGLPPAEWMLADRGYDSDSFRQDLLLYRILPVVPSLKGRSVPQKRD